MPKPSTAVTPIREWGDPTGAQAQLRRQALEDALLEHGLKAAELARLAKLATANSLYNFLNGYTASMSNATWQRLLPYLPRSDVSLLLGLTDQNAEAPDLVQQKRLHASRRRRTVDQVAEHISQVKKGLTNLQQIAATCIQQLAVLEARFADLQDKS